MGKPISKGIMLYSRMKSLYLKNKTGLNWSKET